jgi:probable F420-dependent oxidoreductase
MREEMTLEAITTPARTRLDPAAYGAVGIWSRAFRYESATPDQREAAALALAATGVHAAWMPGGAGGAVFEAVEDLCRRTPAEVHVATGVLNIWMHAAADVGEWFARIEADHPGRFLLGLGVSHPHVTARYDMDYERPLEKMTAFLHDLDGFVPTERRLLAALGPKMQLLAARAAAGTHPFLVTPDHTAASRELLGAGPFLAPQQKIVLERGADAARAVARADLDRYLAMPNYTRNMLRGGFEPSDLGAGGSDRLVDALYAWGETRVIADRVEAHLTAGADHVAVEVVAGVDDEIVGWPVVAEIAGAVRAP